MGPGDGSRVRTNSSPGVSRPSARWFGDDERLGTERAAGPQTVAAEYSSPNVAKEVHVGHLRTTIVGDAVARILDFAGHHVRVPAPARM